MLSRQSMPAADLLSGCGLAVGAVIILINAGRMPMSGTYGGVDNAWYASPAAFPIVIGALLLIAAVGLIVRGALRGGGKRSGALLRELVLALGRRKTAQRIAMVFGLLLVYVAALQWHWFAFVAGAFEGLGSGRLIPTRFLTADTGASYWCASFLFLLGFVLLFGRGKTKSEWLMRIGCCGLAPLIVGYLFSEPLGAPLP